MLQKFLNLCGISIGERIGNGVVREHYGMKDDVLTRLEKMFRWFDRVERIDGTYL